MQEEHKHIQTIQHICRYTTYTNTHIYIDTKMQEYKHTRMQHIKVCKHTNIQNIRTIQHIQTYKHSKYTIYRIHHIHHIHMCIHTTYTIDADIYTLYNKHTYTHTQHTNIQAHKYTEHTIMHTHKYTEHTQYRTYTEHTTIQK